MPYYEHVCTNEECKHEWEDEYSVKMDPPKICPKCGQETAKRLISLNGKGVVELFGQDLVDKVKADAKKLEQDAHRNENTYANLLGSDKFQRLQTAYDKNKK
jgi:putative FmdB family regulatory protein